MQIHSRNHKESHQYKSQFEKDAALVNVAFDFI